MSPKCGQRRRKSIEKNHFSEKNALRRKKGRGGWRISLCYAACSSGQERLYSCNYSRTFSR
jgi:hypothetical protein